MAVDECGRKRGRPTTNATSSLLLTGPSGGAGDYIKKWSWTKDEARSGCLTMRAKKGKRLGSGRNGKSDWVRAAADSGREGGGRSMGAAAHERGCLGKSTRRGEAGATRVEAGARAAHLFQ